MRIGIFDWGRYTISIVCINAKVCVQRPESGTVNFLGAAPTVENAVCIKGVISKQHFKRFGIGTGDCASHVINTFAVIRPDWGIEIAQKSSGLCGAMGENRISNLF